jgi:flagella basal body P-ring formation protein FlgA
VIGKDKKQYTMVLIMVFGLLFQVGSASDQSSLFPAIQQADEILNLIQRKYVALAGDSIDVELSWAEGQKDPWLNQAEASQVSVFPVNLLIPGKQVVTVEIRDKEGKIKRRHLNVNVKLKTDLAFPKQVIKRGETIEEEDLEVVSVELGGETITGLACRPQQLVGMEAARCLSPGSPIRWDHVESPSLVQKGREVECVYDSDAFTIRARGTALESGAMGDEIWVRLEKNGKRIKAIVTDNNQVSFEN